jgi:cellulose synthase/poly-beta-1,6-N-acetylglucosamine synthase-like glycosyltransferase
MSTLVAAGPATYLALLTAAGAVQPRRAAPSKPVTRFAVLVPAHDEALGIGVALDSLLALDYPPDLYRVHVVADNCTDDTAEVVRRKGCEAHERRDPTNPGKGPALNWLSDRLEARGDEFDAVAVVDADTSLDAGFLLAMDRAVRAGAQAAQGYYSVREPDASPAATLRYAALACRHHLRPLGRNRLGGSSGLYGNGMVFDRKLMAKRRWSGHLVEDAEFQNELLLDGHLVHYVPDAVVRAEMPTTMQAATTQNERWERGRLEIARRYVPTLAVRLVTARRRRIAFADAIGDHLTPPLSTLIVIQSASASIAALLGAAGNRTARRLAVVNALAMIATVGHVVAGLASVRAPTRYYVALAKAPKYVVWKVRLWSRMAQSGADVSWTRTLRNAEVEP